MNAPPCRAVLSYEVTHTPVRSSVLLCVFCVGQKIARRNTRLISPIIGQMLSSIGTILVLV